MASLESHRTTSSSNCLTDTGRTCPPVEKDDEKSPAESPWVQSCAHSKGCGRLIEVEYCSGATYYGCVRTVDNRRHGHGTFGWSNGLQYIGQFVDGHRHGRGIQGGPELSRYDGEFENGYFNGRGCLQWPNGEIYDGFFHKDRRHGRGIYEWPDGCRYEGTFFADLKEGYGKHSIPDGRTFQGLYLRNERHGPGLLSYPDGRSDKGFWNREQLVRLCNRVAWTPGLSVVDHGYPEPSPRPEQPTDVTSSEASLTRQQLQQMQQQPPSSLPFIRRRVDQVQSTVNSFEPMPCGCYFEDDENAFDPNVELISAAVVSDLLPPSSLAADLQTFDETFFAICFAESGGASAADDDEQPASVSDDSSSLRVTASAESTVDSHAHQVSREVAVDGTSRTISGSTPSVKRTYVYNATPSHVAMMGHVMRFRCLEPKKATGSCIVVNDDDTTSGGEDEECKQPEELDVDAILSDSPPRQLIPEKRRGPRELLSEWLIGAAVDGQLNDIEDLLDDQRVSPDVADSAGQTALLVASVLGRHDVIDCLLDHGADINRLDDQGVSSLSACFILFGPPSSLLDNFADRDRSPTADLPREPVFSPLDTAAVVPVAATNETSPASLNSRGNVQQLAPPIAASRPENGRPEETSKCEPEANAASASDNVRQLCSWNRQPTSLTTNSFRSESVKVAGECECTKLIGRICVNRSPKVEVEVALHIDPVPEIYFDSDGKIFLSSRLNQPAELKVMIDSGGTEDAARSGCRPAEASTVAEKTVTGDLTAVVLAETCDSLSSASTSCTATNNDAIEGENTLVLWSTVDLLLKRGANPNASVVPMPVIFFAVRRGEPEVVRRLLEAGADPDISIPGEVGGLKPLHFACGLVGGAAVQIVRLLVQYGADRNARAEDDESYVSDFLKTECRQDEINEPYVSRLGGRTPLHIVCSRDDNFEEASAILSILLSDPGADTELMSNGHTPLTLAIITGNDKAVRLLLDNGCDPSVPLTHGLGSALCAATLPQSELRRAPDDRIALIDALISAGADPLTPVAVGPLRQMGNVADYANYAYSQDPIILPVAGAKNAPTAQTVEQINAAARIRLLAHLGDCVRKRVIELEKDRIDYIEKNAAATALDGVLDPFMYASLKSESGNDGRLQLYRYCYECGRTLGVELFPCSRCGTVFYCSKECEAKSWSTVHEDECLRATGDRSSSPGLGKDSANGRKDDDSDDGLFGTRGGYNAPESRNALKVSNDGGKNKRGEYNNNNAKNNDRDKKGIDRSGNGGGKKTGEDGGDGDKKTREGNVEDGRDGGKKTREGNVEDGRDGGIKKTREGHVEKGWELDKAAKQKSGGEHELVKRKSGDLGKLSRSTGDKLISADIDEELNSKRKGQQSVPGKIVRGDNLHVEAEAAPNVRTGQHVTDDQIQTSQNKNKARAKGEVGAVITKMKTTAEANPSSLKIQMMVQSLQTHHSDDSTHGTKGISKTEQKAAKGFEWQNVDKKFIDTIAVRQRANSEPNSWEFQEAVECRCAVQSFLGFTTIC